MTKKQKTRQEERQQEVIWQPISRLPLIAHLIQEGLADAENQCRLLEEGKEKPHVFDDALVERINRLYSEKLEFVDIYVEQIERWKKETLTIDRHFELQHLIEQVERLRKLCVSVLKMTEEIGKGTIDKIMAMADAELGLRSLDNQANKSRAGMSSVHTLLPTLTVNREFISEFLSYEKPSLALGLVEERNKACGFLALRAGDVIPAEVTAAGFNLGHRLMGTTNHAVLQFTFEFYGFNTYNGLINPNNEIARSVLTTMIESGDYFFFVINSNGNCTAFRTELGEDNLVELKTNLQQIQESRTSEIEYKRVLSMFRKKPDPPGTLLNWVCRDNIDYLDLSKDRLELSPARQ